jgi:hypothetical protein
MLNNPDFRFLFTNNVLKLYDTSILVVLNTQHIFHKFIDFCNLGPTLMYLMTDGCLVRV